MGTMVWRLDLAKAKSSLMRVHSFCDSACAFFCPAARDRSRGARGAMLHERDASRGSVRRESAHGGGTLA